VAKFFDATRECKPVKVWGSGVAIRDCSYCDDFATALIAIIRNLEGPVNMGSGMRHSISDIVEILHAITNVPVEWDSSKPDGQLVRYYNLGKLLSTGFKAKISLAEGVRHTYEWYVANSQTARR